MMNKQSNVTIQQVQRLSAVCQTNDKIEFVIQTTPHAHNPCRAAEIAMDAVVTLPSGRIMQIP